MSEHEFDFTDDDLFPSDFDPSTVVAGDETASPPKSEEVLNEEFYDLCAWLRDLDTSGLPEHLRVAVTIHRDAPLGRWDAEAEEFIPTGEVIAVPYDVQRYDDEEIIIHVHGPGVCMDLIPEELEKKRPRS